MAVEFVVAGRSPLPNSGSPWQLTLENEAGSIWIGEAGARYGQAQIAEVFAHAERIIGWKPACIIFVRKAWDRSQAVAEELATALSGIVFSDYDNVIFFDAAGQAKPVAALEELVSRVQHTFDDPSAYFQRWEKEERGRIGEERRSNPQAAKDADWSDVLPETLRLSAVKPSNSRLSEQIKQLKGK